MTRKQSEILTTLV